MPKVRTFAEPRGVIEVPRATSVDPNIGSGVFRASQEITGQINKRARTMLEQYDASRSREAFNDFRELATQKTIELKNLKGKDAIGAGKKYQEFYDKDSLEISGKLDNPIQQEQYSQWSENRKVQDLSSLAGHEAAQVELYNISVHAGELAHSQGDIMAHFANEERIEGENGVIQGIRDSFERTYPGVNKDKEVQAAIANARGLRVQLMAEDNPIQAEKLLEKYKVSLGPSYLTLKDQVDTSKTRKESQVQTDVIRSQHVGEYKKQLESARAIEDPEVRDATVQRVNARKAEDQRIEKENQQINNDLATQELQVARDNGASRESLYDMAAESLGGDGDADARTRAEKLIDSWFKPEPVNWDAVIEAQNAIDIAAAEGEPLTNDFLTLNYGGEVGRKLPQLLARNTTALKNLAKADFTKANENLRNLFNSREFGNPKNKRAKSRYAGLDTELNQFVKANPNGDPIEWLDARMKVYRQEKLAKDLNSWSDRLANINPLRESSEEAFEKLTDEGLAAEMLSGSAEGDDELATRLAIDAGVSQDDLTPAFLERIKTSDEYIADRAAAPVLTEKQIKKALASKEFQDFKLLKLQELEDINQ